MLQPKVTELLLDSGVRVFITPLSRYQRNALQERAEQRYPMPDKTLYEEQLPEDVAIPGTVIPAEGNKDYQGQVALVQRARYEYMSSAMMNLCLSYPDFPGGKAELIHHFAGYLDEQRAFWTLPDDAWEATLRFAIIRSISDEQHINLIVRDETPVTESEVSEHIRIFRPVLSREKSRALDIIRNAASRTETGLPNKP